MELRGQYELKYAEQVRRTASQLDSLIKADDWEQARKVIEKACEFGMKQDLGSWINRVKRHFTDAAEMKAQQELAKSLLQDVAGFVKQEQWDQANKALQRIRRECPKAGALRTKAAKVQGEVQKRLGPQWLAQARQHLEDRKLGEAIALLEQIAAECPRGGPCVAEAAQVLGEAREQWDLAAAMVKADWSGWTLGLGAIAGIIGFFACFSLPSCGFLLSLWLGFALWIGYAAVLECVGKRSFLIYDDNQLHYAALAGAMFVLVLVTVVLSLLKLGSGWSWLVGIGAGVAALTMLDVGIARYLDVPKLTKDEIKSLNAGPDVENPE